MDTIEPTETFPQPENKPGILLSAQAQYYLNSAGKWAVFLAIMGFIGCAFILFLALTINAIIAYFISLSPFPIAAAGAGISGIGFVISAFYIIFDIIFFLFCLYLYQFGSRIKKGIMFTDELQVTAALLKLKSFFKLWGILTIVIIALDILLFAGGIISAMKAASMMSKGM